LEEKGFEKSDDERYINKDYNPYKIDTIMSKNRTDMWIEFGQTKISKLWNYLKHNKAFIIGCDKNHMIIVKRNKNFKKGIRLHLKKEQEEHERIQKSTELCLLKHFGLTESGDLNAS
jgi:hypothetical protein